MDVQAYLDRIGWLGGREPSAGNLAALLRAHRVAVPYETLDLWRGRQTTLDLDALYDKLVTRRRGGYCFELNGLFAALLRELGYEVREYAGRWLRNNSTLPVPRRCHRVVCARAKDGRTQIADAGIGLPFLLAPLDVVFDRPQLQDGRYYRVVRDARLGIVVEMMRPDGGWLRLMSFDTSPSEPIDFDYPHWWCQTSPDSIFRRGSFRVFRLTADGGWQTIEGGVPQAGGPFAMTFIRHGPDGTERRTPLPDETTLAESLLAEFGVREQALA